ncbi:hypothetical protein [Thermodesulfitimonas autotrophica]|uniref:hypothetical protein n=1 Tax=Thermodesulfitimonas autotrophica TaxID=1894989 RepID=UPI002FE39C55
MGEFLRASRQRGGIIIIAIFAAFLNSAAAYAYTYNNAYWAAGYASFNFGDTLSKFCINKSEGGAKSREKAV